MKEKRDWLSIGRIGSMFMDSGAFGLHSRYIRDADEEAKMRFYQSTTMRKYLDAYAEYILANNFAVDYYVNVDAIFNPQISWRNLKYLRKAGIKPVPVLHHGASVAVLERHLEAGYDFIGFGGLANRSAGGNYQQWLDTMFSVICKTPDKTPCVKTHGFAITSWHAIHRYPWYSVDSASWIKAAAYGRIYIPRKRRGEFVFDEPPFTVAVSHKASGLSKRGDHILNMTSAEYNIKIEWLESLGLKLGTRKNLDTFTTVNNGLLGEAQVHDTEVGEYGVFSHHRPRAHANLIYFERMAEACPPYPRPFKIIRRPTLFD